MLYMQHEIIKSRVCSAETGKPLYEVAGKYAKPAAKRPFLPTIEAAREWIRGHVEAEQFPI